MTNQESVDQAYEAMIDDYLTGNIHLLSDANVLHCIDKFGLMPALEDMSVLKIQKMYKEYEEETGRFLKDNKKFTVQVQYSVEEDLVFYGKDEQDVYEQAQNYELPSGYMEGSFYTRAIFDENGTQFFDKDNRF